MAQRYISSGKRTLNCSKRQRLMWQQLPLYIFFSFLFGLDQKQVVEAGENALLLCCDSSIGKVEKLSWIRSDLGTNMHVFFYRENRLYENIQHPSFRGRVKLSDPQINDGNVSLILFNTTPNDTGTYECYVVGTRAERRKRAVSEAQHVVQLKVKSISKFVEFLVSFFVSQRHLSLSSIKSRQSTLFLFFLIKQKPS